MKEKKILLVEDDPNFGGVLKDFLTVHGLDTVLAIDGEKGLTTFKKHDDIALCILDVMMPKKSGFKLAQEIKILNKDIPIIFLTAKGLKEDVLKGYSIGATDYLTKPFDSEVLMAKIKAILSRNTISIDDESDLHQFVMGNYKFNSKIRELTYKSEKSEKLSPKENLLLKLLVLNKEDVVRRKTALIKIWKEDNYFTARSMDVYIARLRKKLSKDSSLEILNMHGEGFRFIQK